MLEAMLTKLVKGQDSQDANHKKIQADILVLTQKVQSHSIAIKKLEHLFRQISAILNQRQLGTLSNNIIQNPKNIVNVLLSLLKVVHLLSILRYLLLKCQRIIVLWQMGNLLKSQTRRKVLILVFVKINIMAVSMSLW